MKSANKDCAMSNRNELKECQDDSSNQEMFWINSFLGTIFMMDINCSLGNRISGILQEHAVIYRYIPKSWRIRLGISLLIGKYS